MEATKHGALTLKGDGSACIRTLDGKKWVELSLPAIPTSLSQTCELALQNGLTHLWILPYTNIIPDKEWIGDTSEYKLHHNYTDDGTLLKTASGWKLPHGKYFQIVFPLNTKWAGDSLDGWVCGLDAYELLITIYYIEKVIGIPVSGSPSTMGWKLLEECNEDHLDWIASPKEFDLPFDLKAHHFGREATRPLISQRPLTPCEKEKLYLHKYDKNSDYPSAATSNDSFFGVGIPYHGDSLSYGDKEVGVWRCTVGSPKHAVDMPQVWTGGEWIAGPIIRLLRKTGHHVQIHEGWVFSDRHLIMQQWGKRLWDARVSLENTELWKNEKCRLMARKAVKQIGVATIGLTGSSKFVESECEKRRPDLNMQVVARSREVMYHNILKFRELYKVTPVLIYMDALYYFSNEKDGRKAFPEIVKRETQLGGFKYEGCIEMSKEVLDILQDKTSAARKLELLNNIGWEIK